MIRLQPLIALARMPSRQELSSLSRYSADISIAGCVFVAPLMLGGRHDMGRLIYAVCVALLTLSNAAGSITSGKPMRFPAIGAVILLAAFAVLAFQVIPLPPALIQALHPDLSQTLPLWFGDGAASEWNTISLTPAETREGLALLIAHGLLLIGVTVRLRNEEDIHGLLGWIALSASAMALMALLQYGFPNGKVLWIYDHPQREFGEHVQGSFANRNHLANFLAFGAFSLIYFVLRAANGSKASSSRGRGAALDRESLLRLAAIGALLVVTVTLLATSSRGGIASLVLASALAGALAWWRGLLSLGRVIAMAVFASLVLTGLSLLDYDRVTGRLDDLVSGEVEQLDQASGRRLIWQANARAFLASPWLGHGAGSHRFVYPIHIETARSTEYSHAESGYLQIATETGAAGLLLLAVAMLWLGGLLLSGIRRAESDQDKLLWIVLAAGTATSLFHAVVDFVWYLPSLMCLLLLFAACVIRLHQIQEERLAGSDRVAGRRSSRRSLGWPASFMAGAVVAGGVFGVVTLWQPACGSVAWDRYLQVSRSIREMERRLYAQPEGQRDPMLPATIGSNIRRTTELLQQVVLQDPRNARAHARLAGRCMQRFEQQIAESDNPMSIEMIRNAALGGGFDNPQERRDWLRRAFGDSIELLDRAVAHATQAVRLCPLQGESYLQMASLAFLSEQTPPIGRLVDQAILVRPKDGRVLFEAGRQQHLSGRVEEAFESYRISIRMPGSHRERIVASLSRVLPAEVFLREIRPDFEAVGLAQEAYAAAGSQRDLVALADYMLEETLQSESEIPPQLTALRWRRVSIINRALERYQEAVQAAGRGQELAPYNFWVRLELASALYHAERFDEADPHIRWCLARRPDIRYLRTWLQDSAKRSTLVDRNRRSRLMLGRQTLGDSPAARSTPRVAAPPSAILGQSQADPSSTPGIKR